MSNQRLLTLFCVFLLSMPMLACGDDGSGADVALFINSNVVDYYDPDDPEPEPARAPMAAGGEEPEPSPGNGSEASNMEAALGDLGANVTTFTAVDYQSLETVLEGQDVLVLPENESDGADYWYSNAFDENAIDTIYDFVAEGGTLVMAMDGDGLGVEFLNDVFGWSLDQETEAASALAGGPSAGRPGGSGEYSLDTGEAEFTPFEGGPEVLPNNDGDYPVATDSLPGNALAVYTSISHTGVAVIPVVDGRVVILSFDWYDAVPVGIQDGGWDEVLGRSLDFEPAAEEVPEEE